MSLHTLGWTDSSGAELFTVGWIDTEIAPATTEFPPGGGGKAKRHGPSARQIQIQQQIEEENAGMLAVVKAFLNMVD